MVRGLIQLLLSNAHTHLSSSSHHNWMTPARHQQTRRRLQQFPVVSLFNFLTRETIPLKKTKKYSGFLLSFFRLSSQNQRHCLSIFVPKWRSVEFVCGFEIDCADSRSVFEFCGCFGEFRDRVMVPFEVFDEALVLQFEDIIWYTFSRLI
uniref:Uncharacterized protein n=1 Tax=Nicotiana tabacum TaxID=4097 RepID=A0A1S3ZZY7_TOBAC|nr:PREDICTED: uncharacterized protein LOC107792311 [Nicotiana tabacum]